MLLDVSVLCLYNESAIKHQPSSQTAYLCRACFHTLSRTILLHV